MIAMPGIRTSGLTRSGVSPLYPGGVVQSSGIQYPTVCELALGLWLSTSAMGSCASPKWHVVVELAATTEFLQQSLKSL